MEKIYSQLKEPLTYDKQIDHLINDHSLCISSKESAVEILKQVNYYRLSAYGIGLMDKETDRYKQGISIEHLYNLYIFDSELRNALIKIIEYIEIQLRSQLSYYLSNKYGADCYLNLNNFEDKKNKEGKSVYEDLIDKFNKQCEKSKHVPFVKHHIDKYGKFPLWVAVELFSFGNLSTLYGIMKKEDKQQIADLYMTESSYLQSWILCLVEIRNICAHYERIYNMPLKQAPFLYKENKQYRGIINRLFPVILVLKRMLKYGETNNKHWSGFYNDLIEIINKYDSIIFYPYIGFPENWKEILEK